MNGVSIVWFRNDLRLHANPALAAACQRNTPILCIYLNGLEADTRRPAGAASKWWLDKSLRSLNSDLEERGGSLRLSNLNGRSPIEVFKDLCDEFQVEAVFWNRRYAPEQRKTDEDIKTYLKDEGIEAKSFNGSLLAEPWTVTTKDGSPYKVFTPFWKSLSSCYERTHPEGVPDGRFLDKPDEDIEDWGLHPRNPDWSVGFDDHWTPGETGAHVRLTEFLDDDLAGYANKRDRPDLNTTSRLSPHLAFGELSPQQIWSATLSRIEANTSCESDGWSFLREIGWRDFSYSLLYQAEDLAQVNWNDRFDDFPWVDDTKKLEAWQKGETGYPIVDAGMRQLWQTGWMHNRVRMIVGSFLVKHLLIHWREGEDWFWDTLVDADVANNPASWQWVAGSGADAAPYFRIFNPMTQGEKFDPEGDYVREWVPELKKLPNKHLHQPWEASKDELSRAGISLGDSYPKPIVDHKAARQAALDAYEQTK